MSFQVLLCCCLEKDLSYRYSSWKPFQLITLSITTLVVPPYNTSPGTNKKSLTNKSYYGRFHSTFFSVESTLYGYDLVDISISNWEYPASTAFNIHQCSYIINYRFSWLVAASDCWLYPSSLVGARMVPPFTPFKTVLGRPWQPSGRSWSNSYKRAMQCSLLLAWFLPSFLHVPEEAFFIAWVNWICLLSIERHQQSRHLILCLLILPHRNLILVYASWQHKVLCTSYFKAKF